MRRIIGGVYFPVAFFLRIASVFLVISGGVSGAFKWMALFERTDNRVVNVSLLFVAAGICSLIFILAIRFLRLIRREDIADIQELKIGKLNKLIQLVLGASNTN